MRNTMPTICNSFSNTFLCQVYTVKPKEQQMYYIPIGMRSRYKIHIGFCCKSCFYRK